MVSTHSSSCFQPPSYKAKSMLQFIGELVFDNGSQQLVLKARVGRNVDLLDMSLYRKGEEGQVMPSDLHIQLPPPN